MEGVGGTEGALDDSVVVIWWGAEASCGAVAEVDDVEVDAPNAVSLEDVTEEVAAVEEEELTVGPGARSFLSACE
jgi:hypothetical protein